MPDPFNVIAGSHSIALNARRLCTDTTLLISRIRDALIHLTRPTSDLKSIDVVIYTLFKGLRAEAQGTAHQRLTVSVQELLDSCVEVFEDVQRSVKPYVGEDGRMKGGWWKKYRREASQKGEAAVRGLVAVERSRSSSKRRTIVQKGVAIARPAVED